MGYKSKNEPGLLKMLWEEFAVWPAEDLKFYCQGKIYNLGCHWRGLTMAFEDSAFRIKCFLDDMRWELADKSTAQIGKLRDKFMAHQSDGSIKLSEGVYLIPPPEKHKPSPTEQLRELFLDLRKNAVDVDFEEINREFTNHNATRVPALPMCQ